MFSLRSQVLSRMLTRKQHELLLLIRDRLRAEGVPPSFDEMRVALGLRSKSGIHRLISGLEERGFIKRLPHRARALEIMRLPEAPSIKKAQAHKIAASVTQSLPLYGRIAAGTPIEALRDPSSFLDVPVDWLAAGAEHYALEVAGDSMIEAGIMNGDQVIIRACETAENGAIVVALLEDSEVTLKYFERRGDKVALIPANPTLSIRLVPAQQVKVQGRLVGLMRRYQGRKL